MQLVIGAMVAIGVAVVGTSAIGNAPAFVNALEIVTSSPEFRVSEGDAATRERISHLFFNERGQLR
jgi:hypothetical protein